MKLISVVIATRNYAHYLQETIESVLYQTLQNWELIVVDDGSTDPTPEVLKKYESNPRIRTVRTTGIGQAGAKNLGASLAQGDWIAFLDGDDLWEPEKLRLQAELIDVNPHAAVVYTGRAGIDGAGNPIEITHHVMHRGKVTDALFVQNFICFSSSMVRKDVWQKTGGFDPHLALGIDYELWLRLSIEHSFDYVDVPLVRYRTGHANLSRRVGERVKIALGTMRKYERFVGPSARRAGYSSTYRTRGWYYRDKKLVQSLADYLHATWYDGRLLQTFKSLLGIVAHRLQVK
ncbi:MAG: glycosyltransferase [Zavarzinella sp.]